MLASSRFQRSFRLVVTLLVIFSQLMGVMPPAQARAANPAAVVPPSPQLEPKPLDLQPLDLQYAISQELGLDDATYHLQDVSGEVSAPNPAQGLRTRFDNLGMQLSNNGYGWGVELAGFGRGDTLDPVIAGAQRQTVANRVEFDHGTFDSWYVNGPLGVQQGWTVHERPVGAANQQLTLALLQSGNLRAVLQDGGRDLQLVDASGTARLSYGGLVAFDAAGKDLPVLLELVDGCSVAPERCAGGDDQAQVIIPQVVRIRVDDRGATYPVTIDPWVKTSTQTSYPWSIVLSEDGATIAVSEPSADPTIYVFTRDAYGVIDPNATARLTFSFAAGTPNNRNTFGRQMAISADGSTIVWGSGQPLGSIGSTSQNVDSAYVFVRAGATWSDMTESATLSPQIISFNAKSWIGSLDSSIAVSADGSTIAANSISFTSCTTPTSCSYGGGGTYIFERPGADWPSGVSYQTTVLTETTGSGNRRAGGKVVMSADGSRVAFSGSSGPGIYLARRNGATWDAPLLYPGSPSASSVSVLSFNGLDNFTIINSLAMTSDGTLISAGSWLAYRIDFWTDTQTASSFWIEGATTYNAKFGTEHRLSSDGSTLFYKIIRDGISKTEVIKRPLGGWPLGGGSVTLPVAESILNINDLTGSVVFSGDGSTLVQKNITSGTIDVYLTQIDAPTPSPAFATAGSSDFTLTLQGSGFSADTRVRWDTTTLPITYTSSSEISVTVPANLVTTPGTVQITVTNPMPGGGAASFDYQIAYPAPVLTSVDPATSYAGEPSLTISAIGSDFASTSQILWNGDPITTTFVNSTLLRADLSAAQLASVGTADVTVNTPAPGGGISSAITHTLINAPTPSLSGISPFTRVAGKSAFTLTAVGSNFAQRSQIVWGSTLLSTTYVNSTTLTAEVSADLIVNEGPVNVKVRTGAPGGGDSAAQIFTVASAAPSIADVFPYFGPPAGGTEVTISGTNLESTSAVTFGLNAATVLTTTETTLVVQAPPGAAGSVDVTVTTNYGTATALGGFVYADSQPAQPWRDFGDVRVWADNFDTVTGTTTATGKVVIGNRPLNQRLYRVSQQLSWTTGATLTISGTLGFFGGGSLSQGTYDLNTATGAITARAGTLPLISTLGTTNLAISPQLTINALAEQVPVTAALVLSLPENPSVGMSVRYLLARDGTITPDGTSPLALKLAGGNLTAAVEATNDGLRAASGQLALPGLAAINLPALLIDDSGLQIGGAASFSLPNIDLGNGVLTLKNLMATPSVVGANYELALSGVLGLDKLPETGNNREISLSGWKLAAGSFQGSLGDVSMTMGGAPLALSGVSLQFVGERYRLAAGSATWLLPASWGSGTRPSVDLSNLTLITDAPFLRFDGATTFTIPGSFTLGGDPSARNPVTFEQVRAELQLSGSRWLVNLTTNLRFRLGSQANDGALFNDVAMSISDDTLSGSISNARLNIGGMPLVATLVYNDGIFAANQASLTLPRAWQGTQVNTGGILIAPQSLRIGPAVSDPSFTLPNISLGLLAFSNNNAYLDIDGSNRYLLKINSTLVINGLKTPAGLLPSESIELTIKGGRIGGTLKELQLSVSGFTMNAKDLQLVDSMIRSKEVQLQLPSKLSGVTTILYGLEIGGPTNFSVQGGGFKLPDFKIGTIGVKNVSASFFKDGNDYVIEAEGEMEFKKFSVEAAFKIAYSEATSSAEVRRVFLAFEGNIPSPAVQIGTTGLYFTRISGEFSLEDESLTITLGTRIATPGKVADNYIFSMDASVTLQLKPSFEFRANADAYVIGMRTASAEVRIWSSGFSAKGNIELGILRASLEITFGVDTWNEFTFYGALKVEIVIPRGYILDKRVWGIRISIPSSDLKLAEASLEGGKFREGNTRFWGARGSISILGGLYSVNALARFGSGGGIELGSNIWRYEPVRPVGYLLAGEGFNLLQANVEARDTFEFTASNPGLTLTVVEVLTTTQRLDPLPLQISSPQNVPFSATVAYTETGNLYRIYEVAVTKPEDMLGKWTVNPAFGNEIQPLGLIPPPEITTATLCPVGGSCAAAGAQVVLAQNQAVDFSWSAKSYTPGLSLDVYATDQNGERAYITTTTTLDQELTGTIRWKPALASGSYMISMLLAGESGAPVERELATLVYSDTSAPAKPQGLSGTAERGLSVLLRWDSTVAEADILGYQVAVDGGAPIEKDGKVDNLRSFGLAPGSTHTFSVAAYDLSGNVGEAAEVTVTMPSLGVSGNAPSAGAITKTVSEVWANFSGYVSGATLTVTNDLGDVMLGTTQVLTAEVLLETLDQADVPLAVDAVGGIATVETGARFVPTGDQLAPGIYTATISAWDPKAQEQVTASWQFQVLQPEYLIFVPILGS